MLAHWVEQDGLARSVMVILLITTLGCFAYTWGYHEGVHNSHLEMDLSREGPKFASGGSEHRPLETSAAGADLHQELFKPASLADAHSSSADTYGGVKTPPNRRAILFTGRDMESSMTASRLQHAEPPASSFISIFSMHMGVPDKELSKRRHHR